VMEESPSALNEQTSDRRNQLGSSYDPWKDVSDEDFLAGRRNL